MTAPETPLDRALRAKALAEKATPGRWEPWDVRGRIIARCKGFPDVMIAFVEGVQTSEERRANRAFMCAARTAMPALADDVIALTEALRETRESLGEAITSSGDMKATDWNRWAAIHIRARALLGEP